MIASAYSEYPGLLKDDFSSYAIISNEVNLLVLGVKYSTNDPVRSKTLRLDHRTYILFISIINQER